MHRLLTFLALLVPAVLGGAQRLPVALIPDQLLITAVRNLVVDHGCGRDHAFALTVDAQRIRRKVALAHLLSLVIVATLRTTGLLITTPRARLDDPDAHADSLNVRLKYLQLHERDLNQ